MVILALGVLSGATAAVVGFGIGSLMTPLLLVLWLSIAVATAGCLIGTVVGERLFLRMSRDVYRRVVGSAVLILGVTLLLG